MEAPKTIAHEIGGIQNDALRFGLNGVKSDFLASHPLESAYHSTRKNEEGMRRKILANTYGSAFPLKMDLDRQILSRLNSLSLSLARSHNILPRCYFWKFCRFQRPPGPIPSSMLGLEALTGSLDDFGFEDYLNDSRESETFRPADMHHGMEVHLGLSKGPVCPSFI
uniref:Cyclin-B1-2-like n=2 Tax=Rhizophora mucronata TaxID=61149 RepID=A0A2P2KWR8_RHIMU